MALLTLYTSDIWKAAFSDGYRMSRSRPRPPSRIPHHPVCCTTLKPSSDDRPPTPGRVGRTHALGNPEPSAPSASEGRGFVVRSPSATVRPMGGPRASITLPFDPDSAEMEAVRWLRREEPTVGGDHRFGHVPPAQENALSHGRSG